jgi:hypothetical protein
LANVENHTVPDITYGYRQHDSGTGSQYCISVFGKGFTGHYRSPGLGRFSGPSPGVRTYVTN